MADKKTIAGRYQALDQGRWEILERVRLCAALSKPSLEPPEGHDKQDRLADNFQSVGSRALMSMSGRIMGNVFPGLLPWFQLDLAPELQHGTTYNEAEKADLLRFLMSVELIVDAAYESGGAGGVTLGTDKAMFRGSNRRALGFRSNMHQAINLIIGTGEVLMQVMDDPDDKFRLKVFRRSQYVTKRDSAGDVLIHIIREKVDPLAIREDRFAKSELKRDELEQLPAHERMRDLYTMVSWEPQARTWKITQELNENVIYENTRKVSPFISVPFDLVPGEDYGRGLIEANLGDLRSLDEIELRLLDILAVAAKVVYGIDRNSAFTPRRLAKVPHGGFLPGARIADGRVQDVGVLAHDKTHDFAMLTAGVERKMSELSRAFLMETPRRDAERVTAVEIRREIALVDEATGGVLSNIAEQLQLPLIENALYMLMRDGKVPTFNRSEIAVQSLTGIAAMGREAQKSQIIELVQFAQVLGQVYPDAVRYLNSEGVFRAYVRRMDFDEADTVKSREAVEAEKREEAQQALELAAAQQAVETTGSVIEARATQPAAV